MVSIWIVLGELTLGRYVNLELTKTNTKQINIGELPLFSITLEKITFFSKISITQSDAEVRNNYELHCNFCLCLADMVLYSKPDIRERTYLKSCYPSWDNNLNNWYNRVKLFSNILQSSILYSKGNNSLLSIHQTSRIMRILRPDNYFIIPKMWSL